MGGARQLTTMAPPLVELEGIVASGLGEGHRFTALDWAQHAFVEALGYTPHPGTFNLRMGGDRWHAARRALAQSAGIAIASPPGWCGARCFEVLVSAQVKGAAVLPDVPGYPDDKLEIVAPVALRGVLGVADGDRVRLAVATGDGWLGAGSACGALHSGGIDS